MSVTHIYKPIPALLSNWSKINTELPRGNGKAQISPYKRCVFSYCQFMQKNEIQVKVPHPQGPNKSAAAPGTEFL